MADSSPKRIQTSMEEFQSKESVCDASTAATPAATEAIQSPTASTQKDVASVVAAFRTRSDWLVADSSYAKRVQLSTDEFQGDQSTFTATEVEAEA